MKQKPETHQALPIHPRVSGDAPDRLRVEGLVGQTLQLTPADLARLPQQEVTDDFACAEGWTVAKLRWRGVALNAVLALAEPTPKAKWVQASAGEFSVPIPLQDARRALLATHLGKDLLPLEHGGPIRLLLPGGDCFTSIKWLDRLELRAEAGVNSGKAIALGRLRSS